MRKLFTLKKILIALLLIFLVMQVFRIKKDNPPVIAEQDFIHIYNPPKDIRQIIESACYDCHSNATEYPWYSNVAPISWWLKDHINQGREEMNFSEWATFKEKKKARRIKQCAELVEEEEMPLPSYTWIHEDARLDAEQRAKLAQWFEGLAERKSGAEARN